MEPKDNNPITHPDTNRQTMRRGIAAQMLKGSGIAAGVTLFPVLFIYGVYLVGTTLPPESKNAADPTPDSFAASEKAEPPATMAE